MVRVSGGYKKRRDSYPYKLEMPRNIANKGTQMSAAPSTKAGSKMRSSKHFEGGGDSRYVGAGKISAFMSSSSGFGKRSSKNGGAITETQRDRNNSEGGGLSLAMIEEHNRIEDEKARKDVS